LADVADARLSDLLSQQGVSGRARSLAGRAFTLAERIRSTFTDWSRQAQARVLALALDEAVLGHIDRERLGLWIRWVGGSESRRELWRRSPAPMPWSEEEHAVFLRYYSSLTWRALHEMLPGRTHAAITTHARDVGVHRARPGREALSDVVPCVVVGPELRNTMTEYGFPLPAPLASQGATVNIRHSRIGTMERLKTGAR
jgi:hypothetical protein